MSKGTCGNGKSGEDHYRWREKVVQKPWIEDALGIFQCRKSWRSGWLRQIEQSRNWAKGEFEGMGKRSDKVGLCGH